MPFQKYASIDAATMVMVPRGTLAKWAHRHDFQYKARPGFVYVRSRAISSRTNDNFDTFPAEELRQAWATFIGKPVFVNHHNDDHTRMRGVIIDAALHDDKGPDGTEDTWVEVLMEVDALRFPKLAAALIKKDIERTSMGTDVVESECSFCGNVARVPDDYCAHVRRMKGQRLRRKNPESGEVEDVLVHEICRGLSFFENSLLVEDPADPTAYTFGLDTSGLAGIVDEDPADGDIDRALATAARLARTSAFQPVTASGRTEVIRGTCVYFQDRARAQRALDGTLSVDDIMAEMREGYGNHVGVWWGPTSEYTVDDATVYTWPDMDKDILARNKGLTESSVGFGCVGVILIGTADADPRDGTGSNGANWNVPVGTRVDLKEIHYSADQKKWVKLQTSLTVTAAKTASSGTECITEWGETPAAALSAAKRRWEFLTTRMASADAITAHGVCAHCHERKQLVGHGLLCQECQDSLTKKGWRMAAARYCDGEGMTVTPTNVAMRAEVSVAGRPFTQRIGYVTCPVCGVVEEVRVSASGPIEMPAHYDDFSTRIASASDPLDDEPDDGKKFLMPDVESSRRTAAKDIGLPAQGRVPVQVETLRPQTCPVCETDGVWNSDGRCDVCGYLPPPKPFRAPDTDVAGRADQSGGWFDPDLTRATPFKLEGSNPVKSPTSTRKGQKAPEGAHHMAQNQNSVAAAARQRISAQAMASEMERLRRENAQLRRHADAENPAQPVKEPAPAAPSQSSDQAMSLPTSTQVTTPGGVIPDPISAPGSVTTPGGEIADPIGSYPSANLEVPVAGTTEPDPAAVIDVQPDASGETIGENAFGGDFLLPDGGTVPDLPSNAATASRAQRAMAGRIASAVRDRIFASLRLAQMQISAGLVQGDMIEVASSIEKSADSMDVIRARTATLNQVASRPRVAAPTPRIAARQAPSLASGSLPHFTGALQPRDGDEALFE